jgi:hypothetical protein
LRQFSAGVLLQKLAQELIILPLGLSFHTGIQLRLKLYIDLLSLGYLPHPPLSPFPLSRGRGKVFIREAKSLLDAPTTSPSPSSAR